MLTNTGSNKRFLKNRFQDDGEEREPGEIIKSRNTHRSRGQYRNDFPRNKYKSKPCWYYSENRCTNGNRCKFLHVSGSERSVENNQKRKRPDEEYVERKYQKNSDNDYPSRTDDRYHERVNRNHSIKDDKFINDSFSDNDIYDSVNINFPSNNARLNNHNDEDDIYDFLNMNSLNNDTICDLLNTRSLNNTNFWDNNVTYDFSNGSSQNNIFCDDYHKVEKIKESILCLYQNHIIKLGKFNAWCHDLKTFDEFRFGSGMRLSAFDMQKMYYAYILRLYNELRDRIVNGLF